MYNKINQCDTIFAFIELRDSTRVGRKTGSDETVCACALNIDSKWPVLNSHCTRGCGYFNEVRWKLVYFASNEEKLTLVDVRFKHDRRNSHFHLLRTIFFTTKARNTYFVAPRRVEKYVFRVCVVKMNIFDPINRTWLNNCLFPNTSRNLEETDSRASWGQSWNQLIEVQFTKAGNCLARFLRVAPTGEKQRTHFRYFRTRSMNNFQQFSLVSNIPASFTCRIIYGNAWY